MAEGRVRGACFPEWRPSSAASPHLLPAGGEKALWNHRVAARYAAGNFARNAMTGGNSRESMIAEAHRALEPREAVRKVVVRL